MYNKNRYIVIGASSKIGRVFYSKFHKKIKFASRNSKNFENLSKFDINKDDINKLISKYNPTHVIIFSAETSPDKCFTNPQKTKKINYFSTIKIIKECVKKKVIPIIFSSDFVFNGKKGNYSEKSKPNPILIYGYHKKMLENFVLKKKLPVLIFRLAKVYGSKINDNTLITNYIKEIKKSKYINVANDQYFSPIYVDDVVNIIDKAAMKNLKGLYNLSGSQKLSRYDILKKIKCIFKSDSILRTCSIDDFKLIEKRPRDISLSNSLLKKNLKYKFKKVDFVIKKIQKNLNI